MQFMGEKKNNCGRIVEEDAMAVEMEKDINSPPLIDPETHIFDQGDEFFQNYVWVG